MNGPRRTGGRTAAEHKFDVAYKNHPRSGYIGLQDHGSACWYKNIKLKPLGEKSAADALRALEKEVDEASEAFYNGNGKLPPSWVEQRWQTYVERREANSKIILEIVAKAPDLPESFAALDSIVRTPGNLQFPFGQGALSLCANITSRTPGSAGLARLSPIIPARITTPSLRF